MQGDQVEPQQNQLPNSGWQFHEDTTQPVPTGAGPSEPVSWTASEFIEHSKSASWYFLLGLSAIAAASLVFLITRDAISTAVVLIVALIFGIAASRKPRELDYQISESGIKIGQKVYPYANFKSFSIVQEGAIESIWLLPLKRFMPMITIYYAPDDGQKIVTALSNFLPVQEHRLDSVDRLMHRLRF